MSKKIKWIIFTFLLFCTSTLQSENSIINWEPLNRNEVVIKEVETSSGIPGVRVLFVVEASRDVIWSTLVDYDNFKKFFHGIDDIKVLEQDEKGAFVEFWIDAVIMNFHYTLYRNYIKPLYHLSWQRVRGDLKIIQGSWKILDMSDKKKKLLIYESYVDIGFAPITWGIRQGAKSKALEMGYRLRKWIEKKQQIKALKEKKIIL